MGKIKLKLNKPSESIHLQVEEDSVNLPEAEVCSKQTVPQCQQCSRSWGAAVPPALLLQVGSVVPGQRALPPPTANTKGDL